MNPENSGSDKSKRLEPMVDWVGDFPVTHGERGHDLDPVNPMACLCGFNDPDYFYCPDSDGEGSIMGATISKDTETGAIHTFNKGVS